MRECNNSKIHNGYPTVYRTLVENTRRTNLPTIEPNCQTHIWYIYLHQMGLILVLKHLRHTCSLVGIAVSYFKVWIAWLCSQIVINVIHEGLKHVRTDHLKGYLWSRG